MHIAAGKGHVTVVETLIESGADVDVVENVRKLNMHFTCNVTLNINLAQLDSIAPCCPEISLFSDRDIDQFRSKC